jgi:hypothetical protein
MMAARRPRVHLGKLLDTRTAGDYADWSSCETITPQHPPEEIVL